MCTTSSVAVSVRLTSSKKAQHERISPDERRHVRTTAGHECLGGEATLYGPPVRPVRPVGPALLWVAEKGASNDSSILGAISLVVDGFRELSDAKDGARRRYDSLNAPFAKV